MNIKGQCLPNVATRTKFLERNLVNISAITSVVIVVKGHLLEQLLPTFIYFESYCCYDSKSSSILYSSWLV